MLNTKTSLIIVTIFITLLSPSIYADRTSSLNMLFDLAENQYPNSFSPVRAETQTLSEWSYRYYSDTDTYIGVNTSNQVHVLGGSFGESPVHVAELDTLFKTIDSAQDNSIAGEPQPYGSNANGSDHNCSLGHTDTFEACLNGDVLGFTGVGDTTLDITLPDNFIVLENQISTNHSVREYAVRFSFVPLVVVDKSIDPFIISLYEQRSIPSPHPSGGFPVGAVAAAGYLFTGKQLISGGQGGSLIMEIDTDVLVAWRVEFVKPDLLRRVDASAIKGSGNDIVVIEQPVYGNVSATGDNTGPLGNFIVSGYRPEPFGGSNPTHNLIFNELGAYEGTNSARSGLTVLNIFTGAFFSGSWSLGLSGTGEDPARSP